MRSVWRLWFVPGKSENPLISQEDFMKVRDLVGVVTLEKKNPRMLTVPVYSSTAANFPSMEEIR